MYAKSPPDPPLVIVIAESRDTTEATIMLAYLWGAGATAQLKSSGKILHSRKLINLHSRLTFRGVPNGGIKGFISPIAKI